jgi:hypothetical protein
LRQDDATGACWVRIRLADAIGKSGVEIREGGREDAGKIADDRIGQHGSRLDDDGELFPRRAGGAIRIGLATSDHDRHGIDAALAVADGNGNGGGAGQSSGGISRIIGESPGRDGCTQGRYEDLSAPAIESNAWLNQHLASIGCRNHGKAGNNTFAGDQEIQQPAFAVEVFLLQLQMRGVEQFSVKVLIAFWCSERRGSVLITAERFVHGSTIPLQAVAKAVVDHGRGNGRAARGEID